MARHYCTNCSYAESIDGVNDRIGCNVDKKQHSMEDCCGCYIGNYRYGLEIGLPVLKEINQKLSE